MRVVADQRLAGAHVAHDVAHRVDDDLVKADLFHLGFDAADEALLAAALARDGDKLAQKFCHVGAVALGRRLNLRKIHCRFLLADCLFIFGA